MADQSGGSASRLAVMLVEDDLVFQDAFAASLGEHPDMRLARVANTLEQAKSCLAEPAPDVLVVDLGLPDGSGIEFIRLAHERWPDCAVMVATTFADETNVIRSIEAGASGYLLKDSAADKIAGEIRSLHDGGSPISPRIARQVLMRFRAAEHPAPENPLSDREQQTLELIAKGFSYEESAALMQVSRNTVMTFVRRIYFKLEVKSKAEAIFEARQRGLI